MVHVHETWKVLSALTVMISGVTTKALFHIHELAIVIPFTKVQVTNI